MATCQRRIFASRRIPLSICGAALIAALTPAHAQIPPTPPYVSGNATWFTALGGPYGGCGVPQANIDSQNFIALNVFNTPHAYEDHKRPLPPEQKSIVGTFNNGHNCGRWVHVKIGDLCSHGFNDGDPGKGFCRGGTWTPDDYNGAELDMVVADSCGDPNAWCRDDPYHIDLAQPAINRFVKNGKVTSDLLDHWNNRQVLWIFIKHPNYEGDIKIGFLRGSQIYWTAIAITNLYNGIHGVEYQSNGSWIDAKMDADMGQAFIIEGTSKGGKDYAIRVRDVDDKLVQNGRVYKFTLPEKCASGGGCIDDYIASEYTVEDAGQDSTKTKPTTGSAAANKTGPTPRPDKDGTVALSATTPSTSTNMSTNATSVPPPKRLCRRQAVGVR